MHILEAANRALEAAGPAVILADDLQWVDGLSLALCHYLVRAAETSGAPLALIAAGRPSANDASLSVSLAQVLPGQRLTRLELGPLASGEALELARSLAPGLGDAQAREVASLAGGCPFWVEALVRTGGAAADAARLVTVRLRGASADAGAVIALLAVMRRPPGVTDLARLNGWPAGRAEHAAQEVVARGLAVESAAAVRLAHDLIRAAVAGDIPEEQRVGIHRRIGRWLAGIAGEDVRRLREALAHMHAAHLPSLDLAGQVLAHDAGQRALRLLQADERVRALHLEALRVEYEAAFQQDDIGTMLRAAEDRAAIARVSTRSHTSRRCSMVRVLARRQRPGSALGGPAWRTPGHDA